MQPDSRKDYSLEDVALLKADIYPESCSYSVECAAHLKLPGWEKARLYLEQLYKQVESGQLIPARIIEPEKGVLGSDEIYLTEDDAQNWQPDEPNPLKTAAPKPEQAKTIRSGKSWNSAMRLIKALCWLIERYETGQPKPEYFGNKKILKRDGNISAQALRELLQEICNDTPSRAEELIKEALRS